VLKDNLYLFGEKKISSHAHKAGAWYLLVMLFEISDELHRPFSMEVPPHPPPPPPAQRD